MYTNQYLCLHDNFILVHSCFCR